MASETVVLDSNNLAAIIADATGQPLEQARAEGAAAAETPAKPDAGAKEAGASKAEKGGEKPVQTPAHEEDDGLTEDERRTLTAKMQKSIAWRVGKMRQAEREAFQERQARLAAEERATTAQRELEQLRGQKVEPKAEAPKEPVPADFQTTEAYMAARVKWEVGQELARERREREQREQREEGERIARIAGERIKRAIELVPDYAEVTKDMDIPVPGHIAAYMQESELFAELGYFFAQHPDELERIGKLRPINSLVALGKIESTLQPFAAPAKGEAKPEANGANNQKPAAAPDGIPGRPRVSVPVIEPLNARGAPEVETPSGSQNGRQAVASFEKRSGANLSRRQRH